MKMFSFELRLCMYYNRILFLGVLEIGNSHIIKKSFTLASYTCVGYLLFNICVYTITMKIHVGTSIEINIFLLLMKSYYS